MLIVSNFGGKKLTEWAKCMCQTRIAGKNVKQGATKTRFSVPLIACLPSLTQQVYFNISYFWLRLETTHSLHCIAIGY